MYVSPFIRFIYLFFNFLSMFPVLSMFLLLLVVDESCVGESKAKSVCAFLQELNDAVKAKFIEEYPEALIEMNPPFFSQFTLVVATQVYIFLVPMFRFFANIFELLLYK